MKFLSTRTHTIIGLIVGVALLLAPNIFGFSGVGGAAVMVPRIIGIIILLSELTTTSALSPIKMVPMKMHVLMDMGIGAVLALSPWLFGFANEEANAWVPHLVVGLLVIGYALVTKTDPAEDRSAAI